MKRIVLVVAALAAGLATLPAPAGAAVQLPIIEAPCTAGVYQPYSPGPPEQFGRFYVEASPPSPDETQPWVTTQCEVEWFDARTGEWQLLVFVEETVPGPTGVLRKIVSLYEPPTGADYRICTRVWTHPVRVEASHGCFYAFTY